MRKFFIFNNEEISTEEMCRRLDQLIEEEEARVFQTELRMNTSTHPGEATITETYERSE